MPKDKGKEREQYDTSTEEPLTVPPGYCKVVGPRGVLYVVPEFLIPATSQELEGFRRIVDNNVDDEFTRSQNSIGLPSVKLGAEDINVPSDLPCNLHELLSLHSEICAVQAMLRISYKDACYKLYQAECEKIKAQDQALKALYALSARTTDAVLDFEERVGNLPTLGKTAKTTPAPKRSGK